MSTLESLNELEKNLLRLIENNDQYGSLKEILIKRIGFLDELADSELSKDYTNQIILDLINKVSQVENLSPNLLDTINDLYKNLSILYNNQAVLFKKFSDQYLLSEPSNFTGHILIADDSKTAVKILSDLLVKKGIDKNKILKAYDGHETQLILKKRDDIDLLFLDWMMPILNGIEILKWKSETAKLTSLPVIMMSAINDLDQIKEAINLGITDYIVKPYNQEILWRKVEKVLTAKDNKLLENINDTNNLFKDFEVNYPDSPTIIISEDNDFWKKYIKEQTDKNTRYTLISRLKEGKYKIKDNPVSMIIIEAHFGMKEIKKFLDQINPEIINSNIPVILYFENELQLKELSDEDQVELENKGIIDIQIKHNDFKRLYEKLGNVYVAWHCPFEKLGGLVYVNPFLNQFVQKAESIRKKREKESDLNIAGISADSNTGFAIELHHSYDLENGNTKHKAFLEKLNSGNYPLKLTLDYHKFEEIDDEKKLLESMNFLSNSFKENLDELTILCPLKYHEQITEILNSNQFISKLILHEL